MKKNSGIGRQVSGDGVVRYQFFMRCWRSLKPETRHLSSHARSRIAGLALWLFAAVLCLLGVPMAAQAGLPWGENLLRNSSFEAGADGWRASRGPANATVEALKQVDGCAGERSLGIANPPETGTNIESPVVELSPGWYLFAFWYRFDLRGDRKPQQLVYVDRYTGDAVRRRRDSLYFYYHSEIADKCWQLAFLTFRLREGDTGVGFRFVADITAAALAIDAIQLRRLNPPQEPGLVTGVENGAYGTDRITDPLSPNGFAHRVAEGKQTRGGKVGGSSFASPPGFYRVTYRFRQEKPGDGPGHVIGVRTSGDDGAAMDTLTSDDFHGSDYQAFTLYWLYPFGTGCGPGWDWQGKGIYRYASVTLEQLQPLTARQAWDLLAEGVDLDKTLPASTPPPPGTKAWVAAGLYTAEIGIRESLDLLNIPWRQSFVTSGPGGLVLSPPLPDLRELDVVVLANIPSRAIPPITQLALRRFVERGGTLLVSGGFYAFGHGGYQGSFLEELLPVAIRRPFDLTPVDAVLRQSIWWFPARIGGCAWVHDVELKPGAEVLYRAAARPGVTRWTLGRGQVVAISATVLGSPDTPFWTQPQWPELLATLLTAETASPTAR